MKDREELRNCFRRNLVQVEGDTELFDTELTIDQILKWHTSRLEAEKRNSARWRRRCEEIEDELMDALQSGEQR